MYFYQDHFIWGDDDRTTDLIFRVDVPLIDALQEVQLSPESPALYWLLPLTRYKFLDFEIRVEPEGMIWRQNHPDEGWSRWYGVRPSDKVFREPVTRRTAWAVLLEDSP